ncbi:MAG: hydrogenase iron-sulfur subunit [Deltaproteobacteria bacterium]|nr:hydrogenase iron-sulfur subunit [Deltaproteobacteria bacterium]MBW2070114.1 hydrogenase iron-sulfur subunit [Deltaproteobacteria bacterium]
MENKLGVYICQGCGLGEALKIDGLEGVAADMNIEPCRVHPTMCSPEGVDLIKQDLENEGVNTVVIAACSRRVLYDVFNFGHGIVVERVNLREGVVWSHKPIEEGEEAPPDVEDPYELIQEMAEDYLRMGIAKAQRTVPPEPYEAEITKKILVLGGGVSGLSAALEAARAGYETTVIEKSEALGGYAAKLRKQVPWSAPYESLQDPIIDKIIKEAEAHEKITIRTGVEVARIAGAPGLFDVTLKKAGTKSVWDIPQDLSEEEKAELEAKGEEIPEAGAASIEEATPDNPCNILLQNPEAERFGAVVLATGWKPYEPAEGEFEHLGFGKSPNVVTNVALEEMAAKGKIVRPSDGKPVQSIAFIQSPGQGSDADFPYAAAVTSLVALKQAKYVREDNKEAKAYIFYQHMRTLGLNEYFYKSAQDDEGVFLTKGDVVSVSGNGDGTLELEANDTLLGERIKVNVDMVVLGTGMVPTTRDDPIMQLAYRQGPGFRDLDLFEGYADSNFICFPYETRRTGIYTVGTVRRSMSIPECMEDAAGAALKAIQCLESANRGVAVHPRSGDMTYPDFYFQRCTQCKRCTEECPFGALDDDEKGTPLPNPTRCRRCGICMGACPERIINFADYSIDNISSMIKAIEVPEEYDEKPRILVLACENDAYPALDICGLNGLTYSPYVRVIPVRCLGSVNVVWIKDSLAKGIDGILMIGCKYGDDYQCHMIKGSELADIRMDKIGEALKSLALEKERVQQKEIAIDEYDKLPGMIAEFMETMEEIGPNPFKGF